VPSTKAVDAVSNDAWSRSGERANGGGNSEWQRSPEDIPKGAASDAGFIRSIHLAWAQPANNPRYRDFAHHDGFYDRLWQCSSR
jgi:hypothetical protein